MEPLKCTLEQIASMSPEQRKLYWKDHPDQYKQAQDNYKVAMQAIHTPQEQSVCSLCNRLLHEDAPINVNDHYHILSAGGYQFLVNKHDTSLGWSLQSVQEEIENLLPMVQGLVLDIGANVGAHSAAFSKKAQRVIAFEPQPHTYRTLCANLALNCCVNVEAHQIGLGAKHEHALILPIDPVKDHASQGARLAGYGESIEIMTLDSFGYAPVSFIKIDVEEMELEVLYGAQKTLKSQSPIVYVEIHNDQLLKDVPEYMGKLGYEGTERIVQRTGYDDILSRGWLFYKPGRVKWV